MSKKPPTTTPFPPHTLLFTILISTLLHPSSCFDPLHNFNQSILWGQWNVTTLYDLSGTSNSLTCTNYSFTDNQDGTVDFGSTQFDFIDGQWLNSTIKITKSALSSDFLYAGVDLMVAEYFQINGHDAIIWAANWTKDFDQDQIFVYGFVKGAQYTIDLTHYLKKWNLNGTLGVNLFYVLDGCYTNPEVKADTDVDVAELVGNKYNVLALYDVSDQPKINWAQSSKVHANFFKASDHVYDINIYGLNEQSNLPFALPSPLVSDPYNKGIFWNLAFYAPTSFVIAGKVELDNYIMIAGDESFALLLSKSSDDVDGEKLKEFKKRLGELSGYQQDKLYVFEKEQKYLRIEVM